MKNEQRQASREIIAIVDAHHNYRIGNFEFDHTERTETRPATIYINCVSRDGKTSTCRFKVEHINDRGYRLIENGDISIVGVRVCVLNKTLTLKAIQSTLSSRTTPVPKHRVQSFVKGY